jgi:hypothetical protein
VQGLAFIASDALASVSCLDSGNLVHVSSTWTDDIPPELSQLSKQLCYHVFRQHSDLLKRPAKTLSIYNKGFLTVARHKAISRPKKVRV